MKPPRTAAPLLLAAVAGLSPPAHATDVSQVLDRARSALHAGRTMQADLSIEVVNERGEGVLWSGTYRRREDPLPQVRIDFQAPSDLAGVYVIADRERNRPDRFRVYLPSIRRMRTIVEDMRGESFLGTDFNYEDLGIERLRAAEQRLLREETVDGRRCWVVESVPATNWWYGRLLRWIDQETNLPIRVDYFDPAGMLYKRRTMDRIEQVAGHPTPLVLTMTTVPIGTKTVLRFSDVHYDVPLDPKLFE